MFSHVYAGSVGYTAQDPWICNATLKDNILMGHDYDEARYQQACFLSSTRPPYLACVE